MISLGIDGGGTNLRFTVNKNGIVYSDRIKKGINITAADENEIEKLVSEMYSLTGNTDFVTGSFSGAGSKERKNIIFKILKKYYKNSDITEILRQYFINHPQSIDKYTFLQNSAFTHWVKEKCSKMC
ncbi:MAG: hypothetical protein H7A30_04065 [Thermotogae bacterium]|nr:hypothetical protein [Thermotogota bacterium]